MKSRGLRRVVLFVLAIAMTCSVPCVRAAIVSDSFDVFLDGVNSSGNLTKSGGTCGTFLAYINTCNGRYVGTAADTVKNCSPYPQVYWNSFGWIRGLSVDSSIYLVGKPLNLSFGTTASTSGNNAQASLVAVGTVDEI